MDMHQALERGFDAEKLPRIEAAQDGPCQVYATILCR